MLPDLTPFKIVQFLVPVIAIVVGFFPARLTDPGTNLGYCVKVKLKEKYEDEVEELGKVTLLVANKKEESLKEESETESTGDTEEDGNSDEDSSESDTVDQEKILKVKSAAAAKVMRGAFDDHYVDDDDDLYEGVQNNIPQQQESVKKSLDRLNRAKLGYRICWLSYILWLVCAILLLGIISASALAVIMSNVPIVELPAWVDRGIINEIVLWTGLSIVGMYVFGVVWLGLDKWLTHLLRNEGFRPKGGASRETNQESESDRAEESSGTD
jgi:hypothetical protein